MAAAHAGKEDAIRNLVSQVVPTYHPAGEHGSEEKGEAYARQVEMMQKTTEPALP